MTGGIIHATKAKGDVYFLSTEGKEVLQPSRDVEVKFNENFPGVVLGDAIEEAKRFAIGAIKNKVAQKTRGATCSLVVRNVTLEYKVKSGFKDESVLTRELHFKAGTQIIKKGENGNDFFWIQDGIVDIDGIEYYPGNIFGRAAFSDGIRKKDAYAKTDAVIIAINKEHPDLINKIPVIMEKFAEEVEKIRSIRPKARIDKVKFDQ